MCLCVCVCVCVWGGGGGGVCLLSLLFAFSFFVLCACFSIDVVSISTENGVCPGWVDFPREWWHLLMMFGIRRISWRLNHQQRKHQSCALTLLTTFKLNPLVTRCLPPRRAGNVKSLFIAWRHYAQWDIKKIYTLSMLRFLMIKIKYI